VSDPPDKPPSPKRFLTAADVAEEIGVSLTSAYEIMRQAGIQPIRGLVRVSRENLEAWLKAEREKRERGLRHHATWDAHDDGRDAPSARTTHAPSVRARSEPEPLIRPTKWRTRLRKDK
jgi:hypothetical protein